MALANTSTYPNRPPRHASWLGFAVLPIMRLVGTLFPFAVLIAAWQVSVMWLGLPGYLYPSPESVVIAGGDLIKNGILLSYTVDSMYRYTIGCVIGILIGIPLGLVIVTNRFVSAMLMPILNFFQSIVELAWIPIFVLWFGYGLTTIVVSIAYVVTFLVTYSTIQGVRRIPPLTVNAVRVLGAKRWFLAREVMLPGALPDIVTGIRLGAGFAFRALIGAELIAAHSGLGYLLFYARQQGVTSRIIVTMAMLGLLWLGLDRIYLKPIEQATVERWGMVTTTEWG